MGVGASSSKPRSVGGRIARSGWFIKGGSCEGSQPDDLAVGRIRRRMGICYDLSARRQTLTIEVDKSLCDIIVNITLAVVVSYNVLFIMSGFETTIPPNSLPWSPLLRGFWFRSPETGKALISYKGALVNSPPRQLLQPPQHHSHSPFPASLRFLLARLATPLTSAPRSLATSNPTPSTPRRTHVYIRGCTATAGV